MREVGVSSIRRAMRSQRIAATPPTMTAPASASSENQNSWSGKQLAQVDVALLLLRELEQRRLLELEHARDDQVRERLDADVVEVDRLVVELAPVRDRLLELGDAGLQVAEALVGL